MESSKGTPGHASDSPVAGAPFSSHDSDSWAVLDECPPSVRGFLSDRINEFNAATTGIDDGRELAIILRDDQAAIVAGLYGWTWGHFCEIETLWVSAPHRGQGLGTRMLQAAEREARVRGARQIGLDTHTFQAPDFYFRHGYAEVGRQEDYPTGHAHLFLSKLLDSG